MRVSGPLHAWYQTVVVPRWNILRLLPAAGARLISALVVVNVGLGLLPVAFIFATSSLVGEVPAAVSSGVGSEAWARLVRMFFAASLAFSMQQVLAPLQAALGERMKRRVDGELRDQALHVVMQSAGIGPMEDGQVMSALSEATRLFETGSNTPGMACAGLLALLARYVRLLALLIVVAVVGSWPAALALGATTMMFRYGQRGGLRKYSAVWRQVAGINRRSQYLRELGIGGVAAKEIRIFGLVEWLSGRYAESFFAAYGPVAKRRREIYLRPYLLFAPVGLVVSAGIVALLANQALAGVISISELALGLQAVALALLLGEFYPECDLPTQFGMQALAALDEIRERLKPYSVEAPPRVASLPAALPSRHIRFEGVSFRYPGSECPVLDRLMLELPAGKCTALVGVNGAGKTTLVKLLTRLYEPTEGVIRADDVDVGSFELAAWRRQVSVIFQDFVRYELSAADNIAMGAAHQAVDLEAVEHAAERAGILGALSGFPLGVDTPLGRAYTGGVELSGGQWQRIAIARSLYALQAGAKLLILDEPTSALDVRAEAAFFHRFVELTRGVTSLLISHRFSSVRRADNIVVIDAGRVVEQGTHAQLVAAGGHYARLFRLQAERFAEPGVDGVRSSVSLAAGADAARAEGQAS
jgi:ATP-binding cassette subfamily B protein